MKKIFSILLLSVTTTSVYADIIDVSVKAPIPNTQWNFDGKKINSYRFNNKTNKTMELVISLDSTAKNSVSIYCWDKNAPPPPLYTIEPGHEFRCTSTDTIKVTGDYGQVYSGRYSISLSTR